MQLTLVVLALAILGAQAGPTNYLNLGEYGAGGQCSKHCPKTSIRTVYDYEQGKTYSYSYSGKTLLKAEGTSAKTDVQWDATVDVTFINQCDAVVKINKPTFNGQQGDKVFSELLEKYPLVVAFNDGAVKGVCHHQQDTAKSINMKMGIASLLQNSLTRIPITPSRISVDEVDVAGHCPTNYTVQRSGESVTVKKSRDYKYCHERFSSPYDISSIWMKTPLPLSTTYSECKQQIENKIAKLVKCTTRNEMKTIAGVRKSILSEQSSTLEFKGSSGSSVSSMDLSQYKRTSLMQKMYNEAKTETVIPKIEKLLKKACEQIKKDLEIESAEIMSEVIRLMRLAPEKSLERIYKETVGGNICDSPKMKGVMKDAIAYVGTSGSTKIVVEELVEQKAKSGRSFLYSINLHQMQTPSLNTVRNIVPLVKNIEKVPQTAALAAGAITYKYCKHNEACINAEPVKEIMNTLKQKVESRCGKSKNSATEKHNALAVLKTIGNLGNMTHELEETVIRCIKSTSADVAVRVAAAQAFRRTGCHWHATEKLFSSAVERNGNTEVKIASYLSAIKCAKPQDIAYLVRNMTAESDKQVKNFVLSHLHKLQGSSNPHYHQLRYMLAAYNLPEYKTDLTRLSRNIDLSYFSEEYGLGGGIDSNLIYSPNSRLPKSLTSNITANILRTVLNIGELGVRFENLDDIVSKLFGSNGYFTTKTLREIKEDLMGSEKKSNLMEMLQSLRNNPPKADVFARVFGQEVAFNTIYGTFKNLDMETIGKDIFNVMFKEFLNPGYLDIDATRLIHLGFNEKVSTPEGIPMIIKGDFTAVVGLSAKNSFDFRKILQSEDKGELMIKPQLSCQLKIFTGSELGVLGGFVFRERGVVGKGVSLKIKTTGSGSFEIKTNIPQEETAFAHADVDIYITNGKYETAKKKYPEGTQTNSKKVKECNWISKSLGTEKLGLDICVEYDQMPSWSEFPFISKKEAKLMIKRSPSSTGSIGIEGKVSKQPQKSIWLKLDTPSCKSEKCELAVDVDYERSAVQIYTAFPSRSGQVARSLKVEVEKHNTANGGLTSYISIYSSPGRRATLKVLDAHIGGGVSEEKAKLDLSLKTQGPLAEYAHIDVGFDGHVDLERSSSGYIVPTKVSIRKCQAEIVSGSLKWISYVEPKSDSQLSGLVHLEYNQQQIIRLKAEGRRSGSWEQGDFDVSLVGEGTVKGSGYKLSSEVKANAETYKALCDITSGSGSTVVRANIQSKRSQGSYQLEGKVEAPRMMEPIELDGTVRVKSSGTYDLQTTLKRHNEPIFVVKGPVSIKSTQDITSLRARVNVQSKIRGEQDYNVDFKYVQSGERELDFMTKVSSSGKKITDVAIELKSDGQIRADLVIPSVTRISLISQEQTTDLKSWVILYPNSSPRKIKFDFDVNEQQRKINADLAWDADNSPQKKATVVLDYQFEDTSASLSGKCTIEGDQYEAHLAASCPGNTIATGLSLSFASASGRHANFESKTRVDYSSSNKINRIYKHIQLDTPSGKSLTVETDATKDKLVSSGHGSLIGNYKINIDLENKESNSEYSPIAKVEVSGSGNKYLAELRSRFSWSSHTLTWKVKDNGGTILKIKSKGTHPSMSSADIQTEIDVAKVEILVKGKASQSVNKISAAWKSPSRSSLLSLQQQSGVVNGEIVPDTKKSSEQYKLSVSYDLDGNNYPKEAKATIESPSKKCAATYKKSGESIKLNMNLPKIDKSNNEPKVHVILDNSKAYKILAIEFYPSVADTEPLYKISGNYSTLTSGGKAFSATVKMAEENIEVVGTTEVLHHLRCGGSKVQAVLTSKRGAYQAYLKGCYPAYLKVAAKPVGAKEEYVIRAGIKNNEEVVFAIGSEKEGRDMKSATVFKWHLPMSMLMRVHAEYDATEMSKIRGSQLSQDLSSMGREARQKIEEYLGENTVQYIDDAVSYARWSCTQIEHWYNRIASSEKLRVVQKYMEKVSEKVYENIESCYDSYKETIAPWLERIWQEIKHKFENTELFRKLKKAWNHFKEEHPDMANDIAEWAQKFVDAITRWIEAHIPSETRSEEVTRLVRKVKKTVFSNITPEEMYLNVVIPLRRPSWSLYTAVTRVGVPMPSSSYWSSNNEDNTERFQ